MIAIPIAAAAVIVLAIATLALSRLDGSREPLPQDERRRAAEWDAETIDLYATMPRMPEIAHEFPPELLGAPITAPPIAGRPVVWQPARAQDGGPQPPAVITALVTLRLAQMIVAAERREAAVQAECRRLDAETYRLRSDNATLLLAESHRRHAEQEARRAEEAAQRLAEQAARDEADFPHYFAPEIKYSDWNWLTDSAIMAAIEAGELPAAVTS